MKKYIVWFTMTDGDYDKEWCYADSEEQAAEYIKDEHWNIKSIDYVEEVNY